MASVSLFPVIMILSIYTIRIVAPPKGECWTNLGVIPAELFIAQSFHGLSEFSKQAIGHCFNPYKTLFNLHTLLN